MKSRTGGCLMRAGGQLLCVAAALASGATAVAGDWPQFRGPKHDGISEEVGFRTVWSDPIPMVWDREIGSAFSSFACVEDRVYTCGTKAGQQVLYCLNAASGKVLWNTVIESQYRDAQGGDGTRATPTVDDGRVYILGAHGTLSCVRADTGATVWTKNFAQPPQWGYSGSILIEGSLAIASAGGAQGALVAFDKATGREVWKCGVDSVGYATPYPFTFEGRRYVVGFTGTSVIIADVETGRQVWRQLWDTSWQVNAASPIFHDGYLFLSSGYRTGCGLFKLRAEGNGLAGDLVWRSQVLMSKFQSCILHDGALYGSDQRALVCADFLTGKEHWRRPRVKHGTLLLAQEHLLLLTQDGQFEISRVSKTGFDPLSTSDLLDGRCWTVPVLHRGRLYVRNLTRIACFNLAG